MIIPFERTVRKLSVAIIVIALLASVACLPFFGSRALYLIPAIWFGILHPVFASVFVLVLRDMRPDLAAWVRALAIAFFVMIFGGLMVFVGFLQHGLFIEALQ